MRKSHVLAGIVAIMGLAAALAPLERDYVLLEGNPRLEGGRCAFTVVVPMDRRVSGCYLNIDGLSEFTVVVNGTIAVSMSATDCPRTRVAAIDLKRAARLLQPGVNRIEFTSSLSDRKFWLRLWASDMAWNLGGMHGHTTHSPDGRISVRDVLELTSSLGGRFWALTDHNSTDQNRDPDCHPVGDLQPVRGTEWGITNPSNIGHANVLGLDSSAGPLTLGTIPEMIDDASYLGGMVQINHPRDDGYVWGNYPLLDPGIDAIEIFNSYERSLMLSNDTGSVAWWQSLLSQGHTIAATGGSDFHNYPPGLDGPFVACTRVYAPSNDPDSILKYSKLGQVMVCDSSTARRLYVYADTNDNGVMDLVMGQHVRVATGSASVRFRVEVENASPNDMVGIWDKTGQFYSFLLPDGGDSVYEWSRTVPAGDTDFVRAELRAEYGAYYGLCTNPIYINHPDYELGPIQLLTSGFGWPDSIPVGEEETLRFRLTNEAGVSPYRFGLAVACDTTLFDIASWQTSGAGIGNVDNRLASDHEVLEWRGGYLWSNRLAPGTNFEYWLTVRPKTPGRHAILFRTWADDRIFVVGRDPVSGPIGPEGVAWHADSVPAGIAEGGSTRGVNPMTTLLSTPTPNPFQTNSELRYSLATPSSVTLCICDASGREVERLVDARQQKGLYRIRWDSRDVPAGVYFCRLRTDEQVAVRKMVKLE